MQKGTLFNRLIDLDKRIVYVFMLLAVSLPFFLKPVVDIVPTRHVQSAFDLVEEAAKKNKPIILGFDYDSATLAELQPMAKAVLRHAFSKNVKVVGINFIPNGTVLGATTMDQMAKEFGKEYGKDYVYLGYLPQFTLVLLNFGDDFKKSYKKDYYEKDVTTIPMLQGLRNFNDFHVVFCLSGTKLPQSYIVMGVDKFHFNFVAGVTAVSATEYFPYLQSGQMKGLIAGMKAAAEYEFLIAHIDDAMRGMASQTWGHLVIIIFIILGNILYFLKKRQDDKEKAVKN